MQIYSLVYIKMVMCPPESGEST